jgi:hypothetical protein
VALIATPASTPASLAAKSATTTIPIVFGISEDPVKLDLVANLARPGGNATGINFFVTEAGAKRLGLLHDLVPAAVRIAVMIDPSSVTAEPTLREVQKAASALGLQIQIFNASTGPEIETAFATISRERTDALFVAPDAFFGSRRVQLAILAARNDPRRREAGRAAGDAIDQVRAGHQSANCQSARPRGAVRPAARRRRGDRVRRREFITRQLSLALFTDAKLDLRRTG